ncbi:MAG: Agmatine deiminase (EC [uncultured Sulfurovum sp.]|uniref:Agmatine deiminase (EC) n=1 Tax=uncultured Sulfurovum sp. TaxID=269237 RepID=A0A6S6TW41_9BACT|nr:MAG: Agmatine deiminase (EC [uncultured Sulfurovum sp.]
MITRRKFIQTSAVLSTGLILGCSSSDTTENPTASKTWFMPDEGELHERTWMAFVSNDYIWEAQQIPVVKADLVRIAQTIAKYEPVSMLVAPTDMIEAKNLIGSNHNYPIDLIELETDDLWMRDTAPTFVVNEAKEKACINFNFNGWGNDQEHTLDQHVAKFVAKEAKVDIIATDLVLEGGCFEIDGEGNAIMTESCIVNDNRNPNKTKEQIEAEMKTLLGLEKVTWLKGIKGKDITDGHTDFYARFASSKSLVVSQDNYQSSHDYAVTRENIDVLSKALNAKNESFELHILETPTDINPIGNEDSFAAGYIGYYLCNGAVILQKFGDATADKKAYDTLVKLFPNRVIEQISIDGIASGGGSIHCATQQEPRV